MLMKTKLLMALVFSFVVSGSASAEALYVKDVYLDSTKALYTVSKALELCIFEDRSCGQRYQVPDFYKLVFSKEGCMRSGTKLFLINFDKNENSHGVLQYDNGFQQWLTLSGVSDGDQRRIPKVSGFALKEEMIKMTRVFLASEGFRDYFKTVYLDDSFESIMSRSARSLYAISVSPNEENPIDSDICVATLMLSRY